MAPDYQTSLAELNRDGSRTFKKTRPKGERAKVTRACDRCKRRKSKCNGRQPCEFCQRAKASCTFSATYARGRVPAILPASDNNVEHNILPGNLVPSDNGFENSRPQFASPPASESAGISSRKSAEQPQSELHGHYIGPASGISFLRRVQKRIDQAMLSAQPSSIFTFGDPRLRTLDFDPSFCMMLPKDDAQRLLDRYFDFAMPTYRFLHRPTIQQWLVEFYDTFGLMRDPQKAPSRVGLLLMVLAHGSMYITDTDRPGPPDIDSRYYDAAERQLARERGSVRLTSIQARLTQCFYLLTKSRVNHCWSLFGTVAQLALAIGLNRDRSSDTTSTLSQIDVECHRRTFWCSYTLDVYLSIVLGRPRLFHDADIDTELPRCIDDKELISGRTSTPPSPGQSMMFAPLAQMRLARISARILQDLYSIIPISADRRTVLTERISKDLSQWRVDLGQFLNTDRLGEFPPSHIFRRQQNVLNLNYWHAIILTHRHSVLSKFTEYPRSDEQVRMDDFWTEESVQQCLVAAMNTANTIDDMTQNRQIFRAFWITAYFGFAATTVLYIYVILKRTTSSATYHDYLRAAARCQSQISDVAEEGSLHQRYCLLLEELRLEAVHSTEGNRVIEQILDQAETEVQLNEPQTNSLAKSSDLVLDAEYTEAIGSNITDLTCEIPQLDDVYGTGWDQFASMVSSGFGNLDTLLSDGNFIL